MSSAKILADVRQISENIKLKARSEMEDNVRLPALSVEVFSTLTPATNADPWLENANSESPQFLVGERLRFVRGSYLDENNKPIDANEQFIARIDGHALGYTRWRDGKPQETIVGLVADRFKRPDRNTLGHMDQSEWEVDANGKPRDPWAKTDYLVLVGLADGRLFTFITASQGGRRALADLGRAYAQHKKTFNDELPIVKLDSDGYQHQDRSIGFVKTPMFEIHGWVPRPGSTTKPTPHQLTTKSPRDELNDEIPF